MGLTPDVSTKQMRKKLKLEPFPLELEVNFVSELEDSMIGQTSALGSSIEVKIARDDQENLVPAAVHEAVHAMQFAEQYVGGKFDSETQAYMVQRITSWILQEAASDKKRKQTQKTMRKKKTA